MKFMLNDFNNFLLYSIKSSKKPSHSPKHVGMDFTLKTSAK